MELKEINTLLFIELGAPVPVVLSSEYKLNLLYYYQKPIDDTAFLSLPKERNNAEDRGVAIITFRGHFIYKFGYPNAEALQGHPYYALGLGNYRLYEVVESDWVASIEEMNRVHPYHNRLRFKLLKHFVITFEDSTFECIAMGLELVFRQQLSMREGIELTVKDY